MTEAKEKGTALSGWSGRSAHAARRDQAYRLEGFVASNNALGERVPPSDAAANCGVRAPRLHQNDLSQAGLGLSLAFGVLAFEISPSL
jgi:hypothetical protein